MAARIEQVVPGWVVMWGAYSRQYWAYPCFDAPPGTLAHAADASDLVVVMRKIQATVAERRW